MKSHESITQALLKFGESIDPSEYFPTLGPAAFKLAYHDPYAFAIATCLDRGAKSDIIWTIPY